MELFKMIKFYTLGNLVRLLTSPFFQYEINPKDASTIFGSKFEGGWNHIIETLKEYDKNPNIDFKDTTLYYFLKYFKPKSISDLVDHNTKNKLKMFCFPWGKANKKLGKKNIQNSRFCGPSSDDFIESEFKNIINLYLKLKKNGYKPYTYPNSHIIGTWLINKQGNSVFLVLGGNHRTAVLSHLGLKKIKVRTNRLLIRKVYEKEICNWIPVKEKKCSKIHAKKVFDFFFNQNGKHIQSIIKKAKTNE